MGQNRAQLEGMFCNYVSFPIDSAMQPLRPARGLMRLQGCRDGGAEAEMTVDITASIEERRDRQRNPASFCGVESKKPCGDEGPQITKVFT